MALVLDPRTNVYIDDTTGKPASPEQVQAAGLSTPGGPTLATDAQVQAVRPTGSLAIPATPSTPIVSPTPVVAPQLQDTAVTTQGPSTETSQTTKVISPAALKSAEQSISALGKVGATTPVIPEFVNPVTGETEVGKTAGQLETDIRRNAATERAKLASGSETPLTELGGKSVSQVTQERQSQIEEAATIADQARQEVLNAPKFDPQRFFKNQTTSQQIFGALGVFLGGLANSNTAIEIINRAIDRDIDAQKQDFAARLDKSKTAKEGVEQKRQQLSDFNNYMTGLKTGINEKYADYLDTLSAASKDPTQAQQMAKLAAEMRAQLGVKAALESSSLSTVKTEGPKTSITTKTAPAAKDIEKIVDVSVLNTLGIPGKEYVARSTEEAKKYREAVGNTRTVAGSIDKIREIVVKNPVKSKFTITAAGAELKALANQLVAAATKAQEGGRMSDKDREFMVQTLGDPTSLLQPNVLQRLEAIKNLTLRRLGDELETGTIGFKNPFNKPAGSKTK